MSPAAATAERTSSTTTRTASDSWSSYGGYAAADKASGVCQLPGSPRVWPRHGNRARRYRAYVEACLTEDDGPLLEAMAASRYAIGGAAFMERTEGQIERRRSGRLQDQDLDLPRRTARLGADRGQTATMYFRACRETLVMVVYRHASPSTH